MKARDELSSQRFTIFGFRRASPTGDDCFCRPCRGQKTSAGHVMKTIRLPAAGVARWGMPGTKSKFRDMPWFITSPSNHRFAIVEPKKVAVSRGH